MNKPPTPKSQQKLIDKWNREHAIGATVTRYKLVDPLRDPQETVTTSSAWLMGGHTAMIMVKGVSGGVSLDSVVPGIPSDLFKAQVGATLLIVERNNYIPVGSKVKVTELWGHQKFKVEHEGKIYVSTRGDLQPDTEHRESDIPV